MNKEVYYLKTNMDFEWQDYPNGFDWSELKEGKDVGYFDFKVTDHLKNAQKGDIVVMHSVKEKRGKYPKPRIIGFGIVSEERKYHAGDFVTKIRKIKDLASSIPTKDLMNDEILMNSKPFRKGSNRCPVTKLSYKEYNRLKEILINLNVIKKNDFYELERMDFDY